MLGAPVGAEGGCRCTEAETGEGQAKGRRNEQMIHGRSGRGPGPGGPAGSPGSPAASGRPVYRLRPSPSLRFGPWWSTGPVVHFGITFWKRLLLLFRVALFLYVWLFGLRVCARAHACTRTRCKVAWCPWRRKEVRQIPWKWSYR